jgi:hypothetical protein
MFKVLRQSVFCLCIPDAHFSQDRTLFSYDALLLQTIEFPHMPQLSIFLHQFSMSPAKPFVSGERQ